MAAILVIAAAALSPMGCSAERPQPDPTPVATATSPSSSGTWLSGASGYGSSNGGLGSWRGRDLDIIGTWSDDNENSVNFWQLRAGGAYVNWTGPIDMAVGATGPDETWSDAASGAYDARWTRSLKLLKKLRTGATGTTFIRFAHEMNGNWYDWQVNSRNYRAFESAWKRYRALQQKIFPESKLVFSVNHESTGTGMDWRSFFPGKQYVDVIGVDYYNQYPYVGTADEWTSSLNDVDAWGAPKGMDRYVAFATEQGVPLALSEWSGVATFGDSPAFVTGMLDYIKNHSGTGPGQIEYDILFNVSQDNSKFSLTGDGARMPKSASAYRSFFQGS